MSSSARVVLEWADGEYPFALLGREIEELESVSRNPATGKNGIGVCAVWRRLMSGDWYWSDVVNVVRLGLIGGGMGAVEAKRLVDFYVGEVPISSMAPNPNSPLSVAQAVMAAAMVGVGGREDEDEDDEEDGEAEPGESSTPVP